MPAHNNTYLTPNTVIYDPTIDPDNMSQYLPKNYKVSPVYEKLDNTSNKDTESLPKYLEAVNDNKINDPSPPYEQFQLDNNNNIIKCKKNKKLFKIFIHLLIFFIVVISIQLIFNPFNCGGNYNNDMIDNNDMMDNMDKIDMNNMMDMMD